MAIKTREFSNIPEWAVCFLAYGDKDGLEKEDIEAAEKWAKENKVSHLVSISDDRYFSHSPAFGLASICVDGLFILY